MSETGFRIFNQAFSAGAELTYAALLTAFFRPFVPQDKRRRGLLLVFFVYWSIKSKNCIIVDAML